MLAASLLLPALLVTPVAAVEGNCINGGDGFIHAGMENTTSDQSRSRSGVQATLDISATPGAFAICNNGSVLLSISASAWVAIQPKNLTNVNHILQVGIIKCLGAPIISSACNGEEPHYFWAYGSCLADIPLPQDLGVANYAPHIYSIWLGTDGNWRIVIDNKVRKILPNTYIGCWSNGSSLREADWSVERHNLGDSIGSPGTDRTEFTDARYGIYNQGWFNPNFYSGVTFTGCSYHDGPDDECGGWGGDNFWAYTAY